MNLSIIVPIYNAERYLKECIDSLLAQYVEEIEFILVDDGSKDNSGKICDEYALKDKRIVVLHQKNEGASSARNTGLNVAKGDYIGFVDADDVIREDMYNLMYNLAKEYEADIVECDVVSGWDGNKKETICNKGTITIKQGDEILKKYFSDNKSSVWCRIYKKQFFDNLKFEKNNPAEDVIINYRLFEQAKKVIYTSEKLYYYRMVPNSLSKKNGRIKEFQSERVANLVLKEHKDVYKYAKMQTYQSALNLFNAEAKKRFEDEKDREKFETIKKHYCSEIRENLIDILKSEAYTKGAKIQFILIAINYKMFRMIKSMHYRRIYR